MNVRHAIAAATALLMAGGVYAQTCSGGSDGGMDATGCDCNTPPAIDARAAAGTQPSVAIAASGQYGFQRGINAYEKKGHHDDAITHLKRSATKATPEPRKSVH